VRPSTAAGPVLAVTGLALAAVSFAAPERPAPVLFRLAGLAALTLGALVFWSASSRRLLTDVRDAVRPGAELGRWHYAALALIVVVGAVVRATFMGYGLRYDEAYSFGSYASVPVSQGLADYTFPNNHLLNTLLMHYSWLVFGDAEWSLRLPTYLFGVALIPAVYAAARSLYTPSAGLLAAALTAGSLPLVEYSANARGYSATWVALALMIPLTVRLMRGPDPAAWVLWTVLAILGVFAVPTMGLGLIVLGVWLGLELLRTRQLARIAELAAASVVVAAWSWVLYHDTFGDPGWDWDDAVDVSAGAFVVDVVEALLEPLTGIFAILALLLAVAGLVLHRRVGRTVLPLPLVTLAVIPLIVLGLDRTPPYERTWLWLAPILLPAVAAGAVAVARRSGVSSAPLVLPVAAVVLALVVAVSTRETDPPWGEGAPLVGATDVAEWLKGPGARLPDQLLVRDFMMPGWGYTTKRTGAPLERIITQWAPPAEGGTVILLVSRAERQTLGSELVERGLIDKLEGPPEKVYEAGELELWRLAARDR
jgi:hypothetical protein